MAATDDDLLAAGTARIDRWIGYAAVRYGIPAHQVDDVRQELVLWLWQTAIPRWDGTGEFLGYLNHRLPFRLVDTMRRINRDYRTVAQPVAVLSLDTAAPEIDTEDDTLGDTIADPAPSVERAAIARILLEGFTADLPQRCPPRPISLLRWIASGRVQRRWAEAHGIHESRASQILTELRTRMADYRPSD